MFWFQCEVVKKNDFYLGIINRFLSTVSPHINDNTLSLMANALAASIYKPAN